MCINAVLGEMQVEDIENLIGSHFTIAENMQVSSDSRKERRVHLLVIFNPFPRNSRVRWRKDGTFCGPKEYITVKSESGGEEGQNQGKMSLNL